MSHEPRRLADYLGHILEAIDRVQRYTEGMEADQFLRSEIVQDGDDGVRS
jgi:uncharacterized protein with HEPN domain